MNVGSHLAVFLMFSLADGQRQIFMGGTLTFRPLDTSGQVWKYEVTAQLAWASIYAPCRPICRLSNLAGSLEATRNQTLRTYGASHFGNWKEEILHPDGNHTYNNDTYVINSGAASILSGLNTEDGWAGESFTFNINLDRDDRYLDIAVYGRYWRHIDYTFQHFLGYHVQAKIKPAIRSDTGRPNTSPQVLLHPVYRVPLGEVTTIHLTPVDPDGDIVTCELARWVAAGGLKQPPHVVINRNCTIQISMKGVGDSFFRGGFGAVPVLLQDYKRNSPLPLSLSAVALQTVGNTGDPKFVDPTPEEGHEFEIYVGSDMEIPLYAEDTSSVYHVNRFYVRSLPSHSFSVSFVRDATERKSSVRYSTITWSPLKSDVGIIVIGVSMVDQRGMVGMPRHFKLLVKDYNTTQLTRFITKAKISFLMDPDQVFTCHVDSTCIFPVYSFTSRGNVVNVTSAYSSAPVSIKPPQRLVVNGHVVYKNDLHVTNALTGAHLICLQAANTFNDISSSACLTVEIRKRSAFDNPCMYPRQCPSTSVCRAHGENFTCVCKTGYTGANCETVIDQCVHHPCVHGDCYSVVLRNRFFLCQCHANWTGDTCDTPLGTPITTTKSLPTTTTTTRIVTTTSMPVCEDVHHVNCTYLNSRLGICIMGGDISRRFCPDLCGICHADTTPLTSTTLGTSTSMTTTTATTTTTTMAHAQCQDSSLVNCSKLDALDHICSKRGTLATHYCPRFCNICSHTVLCDTCNGTQCSTASCDFCMTVVNNDATGKTTFSKMCATQTECETEWLRTTSKQSVCMNFDPSRTLTWQFKCSYCCVGNHCNHDNRIPDRNTLYKGHNSHVVIG